MIKRCIVCGKIIKKTVCGKAWETRKYCSKKCCYEGKSEFMKNLYKEGKIKSWNKGLTKKDDDRIKRSAEKKKGKHTPHKGDLTSEKVRKQWLDPKFRQMMKERMSGPNNPKWRETLKTKAAYHQRVYKYKKDYCEICGKKPPEVKRLEAHHIDKNFKNSNPENIITLCPICHTKQHYDKTERKLRSKISTSIEHNKFEEADKFRKIRNKYLKDKK